MRLWMDRHCWMWFMVCIGMVLCYSAQGNYEHYFEILEDLLPADYMFKKPESRNCVDKKCNCSEVTEILCCFLQREQTRTCKKNCMLPNCATCCNYTHNLQENIKGLLNGMISCHECKELNCTLLKETQMVNFTEFRRKYKECQDERQNCTVTPTPRKALEFSTGTMGTTNTTSSTNIMSTTSATGNTNTMGTTSTMSTRSTTRTTNTTGITNTTSPTSTTRSMNTTNTTSSTNTTSPTNTTSSTNTTSPTRTANATGTTKTTSATGTTSTTSNMPRVSTILYPSSPASSKPEPSSTSLTTELQTTDSTVTTTKSPTTSKSQSGNGTLCSPQLPGTEMSNILKASQAGVISSLTAFIILVLLVCYLYLENRRLKRLMDSAAGSEVVCISVLREGDRNIQQHREAEMYLESAQVPLQNSPETEE